MLEIIAAGFKAIILCSAFVISAIIVVAFVMEVTRTYFARNEACTNWGRACFPTQGIVEFVSNRWVTLMMISPKDSKKKLYRESFWRGQVRVISAEKF